MTIQWYPGHMAKAKRLMKEQLKAVDIIVELRDARIPLASKNPMLDELAQNKSKVLVFTKSDLADPVVTNEWQSFFNEQNMINIFVDSTTAISKKLVIDAIERAGKSRRERDAKRGIKNRALKVMIVGIPNVGKSTLINLLAKKKMANVADRPGVTRTTTWIAINKDLVLMDTPGVLWPKFDDQSIGVKLALTNAIKEQILPIDAIVEQGYEYLKKHYSQRITDRYNINPENLVSHEFIVELAKSKNMQVNDEKLDINRALHFLFLEIKNHKLGKISWERVDEQL